MTGEPRESIVEVRELSLEFPTYRGPVKALSSVSLDVFDGEIVGLVGESGCGKSVTAMALMRLLPEGRYRVTGGRIRLLGRDPLGMPERALQELRGRLVSMIFQEPMNALNPTIRIGRQLVQVIRRHRDIGVREARDVAERLLHDMQLPEARRLMDNFPFELSGGMRQRVLIALAFSCEPRLLIADEPTTALDVTVQAQVLTLVIRRQDRGDRADVCGSAGTPPPLHGGAAALLARTGRAKTPAGHDSRNRAQPPQPAPGLHVRGALPRGPRALLPAAAGRPGRRRRRAPRRVLALRARGRRRSGRSVMSEEPQAAIGAATSEKAEPLLALDGVQVRFPAEPDWLGRPRAFVHAVNGVDLTIRRGETLGVVGESGCGKSRIVFAGHDLGALGKAELRGIRRRFQVVFQDPQSSLNPRMRAWRIISEPLTVNASLASSELRSRAEVLAAQVGLRREQLDRFPHEFSGGQRQRIAVARALALEPDLIVLDEPTSALDVSVQAQILNLLFDLQRQLGLTYLFISHDVSVIRHFCDRIAVMYLGQIVEIGPCSRCRASTMK
jgi:glutathione transport system ATP-binding protein